MSVESPGWLDAVRDKKAGPVSAKAKWFLWADRPDAPEPPAQEDVYVSSAERKRDQAFWGWQWSSAAGAYYWARWKAQDADGTIHPLPQMNWAYGGWRAEAERIVRFWMNTGIDGMVFDAPLCYPNQTWADNRKLTAVVASYGNTMVDPEGGRDPAWVTEAGYNTVHEYGLQFDPDTRKWSGNAVEEAIRTGDPHDIETWLRRYHDAILDAGGVLYARWPRENLHDPAKRRLLQAVMAGIGDIVVYTKHEGDPDGEESQVLRLKQQHPALYPTASRRKLKTNDDNKFYAFLKVSAGKDERIVAVYNFQSTPQSVRLELGTVDTPGIVDLNTRETIPQVDQFHPVTVQLRAYGFRFFRVVDRP